MYFDNCPYELSYDVFFAFVYSVSRDKLKSMGAVPKNAVSMMLQSKQSPTAHGNKFRKASMINQNGLIYKKSPGSAAGGAGGGVGRRSSLSFATRRDSLQGVDNDPTFVYDPIVLLRKNSAIQLGKVYQEVQRHLYIDTEDAPPPMGKGFYGSSRSTKLTPLRRQSTRMGLVSAAAAPLLLHSLLFVFILFIYFLFFKCIIFKCMFKCIFICCLYLFMYIFI